MRVVALVILTAEEDLGLVQVLDFDLHDGHLRSVLLFNYGLLALGRDVDVDSLLHGNQRIRRHDDARRLRLRAGGILAGHVVFRQLLHVLELLLGLHKVTELILLTVEQIDADAVLPRVGEPPHIVVDDLSEILSGGRIANGHTDLRRHRAELHERGDLGRKPEDLAVHALHVDLAVYGCGVDPITEHRLELVEEPGALWSLEAV